jgi:hypothetical protein
MSLHGPQITHVDDPGTVPLPGGLRIAAFAAVAVGALLWLASFMGVSDPVAAARPWQALLMAYMFFLMLGLGGMVFTTIQYVSSARWSIVVRRFAEGMGIYVGISAVLFFALAIGGWDSLWALDSAVREQVGKGGIYYGDPLKAAYMSQTGVIVKGVIFYGLWLGLTHVIRQNSLKSDKTRDEAAKLRNVRLSIVFLTVFAYTFSLHCVDMLMALEGRWFSTIFGVYCFAGLFLSAMAVITLITHAMRRRPAIAEIVQSRHMYDLGTWMMAFSCFMCYILFSQYMLLWYANLPETNFFIIERNNNGWENIFLAIPFLKWIVPFAVLMPQGFRGNRPVQIFVCIAILVGQLLDLYWIIYPVYSATPVVPGIAEIGAFVALLGLFLVSLDRAYSRNSVMPMGDPHLLMCVKGSYV